MRLLFVSHSFPPAGRPLANVGGMQRVATELHEALGEHAAIDLDEVVLRTSWRWTRLKTPFFLIRAYRYIRRRARADQVDVVLFSSMVTAALALLLRRTPALRGLPMAAIVHGRDVTLPFALYQRVLVPRIFKALDVVLPVSRATGRACQERGLPESKLQVVPNGVNTNRFAPPETSRTAAHRTLRHALSQPPASLPEGALLLCSVGRQVERKGFAWFVDSVMPRLPKDVHYWLAGDGPEAERIRQAAARHGLRDRVQLLGRISDEALKALYQGADLFVMPNVPVPGDMEGFGVVMLEAGLSGLPTVAAELEGIQDVITEGQNGHLVASENAQAFAESIRAYHADREALDAFAQRAAQHTAATFGWRAVADQYVQALHTLQPDTKQVLA